MQRQKNRDKVYGNLNVPVAEGQSLANAVETLATSFGIPRRKIRGFMDRLAGRGEIGEVPDRVTNDYLVEQFERLTAMCLASMGEFDFLNAPLDKKTAALRAFIELRQLLKGEPTEIRGYADRSKMMAQVDLLFREAKRRGLEFTLPETEFEEVK